MLDLKREKRHEKARTERTQTQNSAARRRSLKPEAWRGARTDLRERERPEEERL
jgi:hypothetical protein